MRSLNMDSALIAADGLTDASYWVVGDAYFLGKPRRTAVGMTYIFWKGKLYWASKDGKRGGVHRLTLRKTKDGIHFSSEDDSGIGGKGVLIQKEDCLWMYWNVSDRNHANVVEPLPAIGKSESTYRCLSIDKESALRDLEIAGIRFGD